jgi:hypothetical protein
MFTVKDMGTHNADYGAIAAERKKITEAARKLAVASRDKSPYAPEKQNIFVERLAEYVEEQREIGKPLTVAGFILASGIPKRTWYEMKEGKYDAGIEEYKLTHDLPLDADEYINEDGEIIPLTPWSEIIDRCYLLLQQERETACVAGKAGNVIGNIFLLKSQHGLSDQPEQIRNQTNIQIVANADKALEALEMLR